MTVADAYKTWEVGQQGAPPPALKQALLPSEHLLWAAEVPVSRFVTRWILGGLFFAAMAIFVFQIAPWGQSVDEFCANYLSARCPLFYTFSWPAVILFSGFQIYALIMLWKAARSPWSNSFGITSHHSIVINGNKSGKLHRLKLEHNRAWLGPVRDVHFGKSSSALSFTTLKFSDAKRAVYWANEGRFQPEFQNGPTP